MYSKKDEAEASLYEFFKQAWHVMEGGVEFEDEWFLEEISNSLEDCYHRRIKLLLINLPPRKGKTNLISIAYPVWVWLHNPEEKFICASYTNSLSLKIADKSRLLIESGWFQKNWGHLFKIRRDQNSKSYFANDKTGYRMSTSAGSFITGSGADTMIIDDPNDPSGESEVTIDRVNNWWSQKMFNRVNDARTAVRIVVQQRSQSENDVSGNIIRNDVDGQWVKYILPMEYENNVNSTFKDRRTIEGELLSCRDTKATVKQLKREMGSYGYAAQYQQRPAPLEGGMIKKKWFKIYPYSQKPPINYVIQSWDTAFTAKKTSSYSACTTWGTFTDQYDNEQLMLLSTWRGQVEYPELRERAMRLSKDYLDVGEVSRNGKGYRLEPDMILIEAKASGDPLIQDLQRSGIHAVPFIPNKHGDKDQRVRLVSALIESGVIWMPCMSNDVKKMVPFADEFITTISQFPNASSRDYVDTMTQALIILRDGCRIKHAKDYYEPDIHEDAVKIY